MDQGNGKFEMYETMKDLLEKNPSVRNDFRAAGVFSKGEIIEIKGSRFKVRKISPRDLVLRLLPKLEQG